MSEMRILPALGVLVILVGLFGSVGFSQTLPTLYVHGGLGNNTNNGQFPPPGAPPNGPVQTITRALELASANTTAPRTIMIAGFVDAMGLTVVPYDDQPGPFGSPGECFPLPMLSQVSLVWDQANSDSLPTTPPTPARPIVLRASTAPPPASPPSLIRFTNAANPPPGCIGPAPFPLYTVGASPVSISGLQFNGGFTTIEILDSPSGIVRPSLTNLFFRWGLRPVLVRTVTGAINPTISGCELGRDGFSAPPWAIGTTTGGLVELTLAGSGSIGGSIDNCRFVAEGSPGFDATTGAGVDLTIPAGPTIGLISTAISNSVFEGTPAGVLGGTNGLQVGIRINEANAAGPNSGRFGSSVTGCSFDSCREYAILFRATPAPGGSSTTGSTLNISGCDLYRSGTTLAPGAAQGQIWIDFGAGHSATVSASGCKIADSPRSGFYTSTTTYAGSGTTPGYLTTSVVGCKIAGHGGAAVYVGVAETTLRGGVHRTEVSNNEAGGIVHVAGPNAFSNPNPAPTNTNFDIINNMIVDNGLTTGAPGVRITTVRPAGSAAVVSATVRPTHNTIAGNGGAGLGNTTVNATLATVNVWNTIFYNNTGGDFYGIQEYPNTFWCRFDAFPQYGGSPNFNTNYPPGFVGPGDFRLGPNSMMRDHASLDPPGRPTLDFFGNPRRVDIIGVPIDGADFADKGAHEVPP